MSRKEPQDSWMRYARRRRATLVILSLVALLVAVGAGGIVSANRIAAARHVTLAGESVVSPSAPSANQPLSATGQASKPSGAATAATNCKCAAQNQTIPAPDGGVPQVGGQVVVVSLSQQWLWAYQDSSLVLATPVTTGRPDLATPTGTFHIMMKESNVMFYSPWPYGSPYYYTPEHIDYAMLFLTGGYYLHSAGWRHAFGPGTNVPHTDPDGTQETGSHGCVNMPVGAAGDLYGWITDGATVIIEN